MTKSNGPLITRPRAVAYRLRVNHLVDRLSPESFEETTHVGLQDSSPRDAIIGMHARMHGCKPADWQHPSLIQTYSPRAAVYVLPRRDFGVFTLGRLPLAAAAVAHVERLADNICRTLGGREARGGLPELRAACASGRIALRWTTSALWFREVPRPDIDVIEAHQELCRRHVHYFAPTTSTTFAWWTGMSPSDARKVWDSIADELFEVDFDGKRAWILQADADQVRRAQPATGVRLLVGPDLRLLGQDRTGHFVGPGMRELSPAADAFHPNGVLVDGRIVGAWGRKRGWVDAVLTEPLASTAAHALEAEIASLPIPGVRMHASVHGQPGESAWQSART